MHWLPSQVSRSSQMSETTHLSDVPALSHGTRLGSVPWDGLEGGDAPLIEARQSGRRFHGRISRSCGALRVFRHRLRF